MLMIAMNLCHIHASPLNRRHTTTQTSTHLIVLTSDDWLFGSCGHFIYLRCGKNTSAPDTCQRSLAIQLELFAGSSRNISRISPLGLITTILFRVNPEPHNPPQTCPHVSVMFAT